MVVKGRECGWRVRDMEALLAAKKLGKLIQKLLPDYSDFLDYNKLTDENGHPFRTPSATDRAASETMADWMGIPLNLIPIASAMEEHPSLWRTLLQCTFLSQPNPIPERIQRDIAKACGARHLPEQAIEELRLAMHTPSPFKNSNTAGVDLHQVKARAHQISL